MTDKPWSVRYPFQPLADICRARHRPANADPQAATANLTDIGIVVAVTGMGHTSVADWARRGVTEMGADRVAVTLGYHPMNIWPDWGRRAA